MLGNLTNGVAQPLSLLAGVLIPLSVAPLWVRDVALWNPFAWAANGMRAIFHGHIGAQVVWQASHHPGRAGRGGRGVVVPAVHPRDRMNRASSISCSTGNGRRQIGECEQPSGSAGRGPGTRRRQRAAQAGRAWRRHGHAAGDVRYRRRRDRGVDAAVAAHADRAGRRPGRMVRPARHRAARPGRGLRDVSGRRDPQLPRADLARGDTRADEREHAGRDRRRVHPAAARRRGAHRRRPCRAGRARPRRADHRRRGRDRHG